MGVNVEKQLRMLEDEVKAMKVCYNTAGSLVKMYVQKMGQITVGGGAGWHDVTIKFTPTYGMGHNNIINFSHGYFFREGECVCRCGSSSHKASLALDFISRLIPQAWRIVSLIIA